MSDLSLKVLKVSQPIGDFFVASIKASDLVEISYSDVRRMEERDVEKYLGIQRPLSNKRAKDIRNYIINSPDATFPTAIILAVDERCARYNEGKGELLLTSYKGQDSEDIDIPYSKIAKVLDGQHRIAGFMEGDDQQRCFKYEGDFEVNVSIFIGLDISVQAKIFATVNLAQTKVNKSLVYDLEELSKTRSPYKTCHHVAVALDYNDESPFYQRIKRLGVATEGRVHEPLTQASFVEALVGFISKDPNKDRNELMKLWGRLEKLDSDKYPFREYFERGDEGDKLIYDIVYNYFFAIRNKWPNAWDKVGSQGNLLPRTNAFKAFMRYLKNDVYLNLKKSINNELPTVEDFEKALSHVELTDEDFTTKNFVPGSGGQATFYKILTGESKREDIIQKESNP